MTITHDEAKGWSTHEGDPRWRANTTALKRLKGADVYWLDGNKARPVHVAHLASGTPVCVIRGHPEHGRWSVTLEGFEFWQDVRVMNRAMWAGPIGFDKLADAKAFADKILVQAGAIIRPGHPAL